MFWPGMLGHRTIVSPSFFMGFYMFLTCITCFLFNRKKWENWIDLIQCWVFRCRCSIPWVRPEEGEGGWWEVEGQVWGGSRTCPPASPGRQRERPAGRDIGRWPLLVPLPVSCQAVSDHLCQVVPGACELPGGRQWLGQVEYGAACAVCRCVFRVFCCRSLVRVSSVISALAVNCQLWYKSGKHEKKPIWATRAGSDPASPTAK